MLISKDCSVLTVPKISPVEFETSCSDAWSTVVDAGSSDISTPGISKS